MITLNTYRQEWFGTIRADLLSGLVVALALIPEAIAFSIIAGVDPKVGLYASFSIAVISAFTGGRPGMISAATAATAVLMVTLVKDHGLQYLLAATILAGLLQIAAGYLRLGFVMRFVSKSVMTGFVNALAILIFMAQLPELDPAKVNMLTYVLVAAGLAIIYLFPYVTKAIPSPLVTIVVLTALTRYFGWDVRTVSDMGQLPDTLPVFLIPQIPFTLETLQIILPYSLAVAAVGLLEQANAILDGTGKGATLIAEQFGFEQGVGQGAAVLGDEGLGRPAAFIVNGAGDHFLAGARLARHHHRQVKRRNPTDHVTDGIDRAARRPDKTCQAETALDLFLLAVDMALQHRLGGAQIERQPLIFLLQTPDFSRPLHGQQQLLGLPGL